MGLFDRNKIQGDELLTYIDYVGDEWTLRAFQEKGAEVYTTAAAQFDPTAAAKNPAAYENIYIAANQLAQSAAELLRRKDALKSVPDKATSNYFAWHAAYSDYLAWANAQADYLGSKLAGIKAEEGASEGPSLKDLQSKSEESRAAAEAEEQKLLKKLKLTPADIDQLRDRASNSIAQDKWKARPVNFKPKDQSKRR
ncbi:hypothetical protein [Dehalogenimonas etheniformans]|uniref:Uncharacterized protein n=1 Tax=Dehalogenimonas etheniformans TaxID=1536648 RepID=A0A2P5P668_9CHLR|nr:hypothetical protein [Dehalogenimonas etheniformans]PPD57792.1 hypothetical protein JP09_008640 [Dehalogenimonas etheniformans]QNT76133.1 hypothetical protein HX448_05215 [Dehalogenimonas etheniformans]